MTYDELIIERIEKLLTPTPKVSRSKSKQKKGVLIHLTTFPPKL